MESKDKIAISDIVRDLELNVVYQPEGKEFFVKSQDVNRTGLALAGYFEYFAFKIYISLLRLDTLLHGIICLKTYLLV